MAALRTSRFSAATRRISVLSCGSRNTVHQSGSIGSAAGRLATGIGFGRGANQEDGAAQSGVLKSGPNVQPARQPAIRAAVAARDAGDSRTDRRRLLVWCFIPCVRLEGWFPVLRRAAEMVQIRIGPAPEYP